MARDGYVLAFDFGLRHIGTAVGQTVTRTASPLSTLRARNGKPVWSEVRALIDQWQPICLIVGDPLNMDDSDGVMRAPAQAFANALAERFDLPVTMIDERLTTKAALAETGGDTLQAHNLAAVMIAESYLR